MTEIREVLIDSLQPTDTKLNPKTLKYYTKTFPLLRDVEPPKVWEIDGEYLIQDGHHQIYDRINRGKETVRVVYNTPENCGVGSAAYMCVVDTLQEKAKIARNQGIFRPRDMN